MKIRKIIAYILTLVLLVGLLVGCNESETKDTVTKTDIKATKATTPQSTAAASKPTTPSTTTKPTTPQATQPVTPTEPEPTEITTEPTTPPVVNCDHIPSVEWKVTVSCTAEGVRTNSCILCGTVLESETMPIQPHDTEWITPEGKEATCEAEGEMYQQCKQCKKIFFHVKTAKLAHTPDLAGQKCTVCNGDLGQKVEPAE